MLAYERKLVEQSDTLLLGRVTHSDFAGYWPGRAGDPSAGEDERGYARRVDTMGKVVVSQSGEAAGWNNSEVLRGLDTTAVLELKNRPGKDIVMYGSLSVVNRLAELNMIDEYHLLVHPIVLGKGKPLFTALPRPLAFDLASAEAFGSGVVLMKQRPTTGAVVAAGSSEESSAR